LFRALPSLEDRGKLKAFACRIAHNRCVDHVVRHAAGARPVELSHELPSGETTPEEKLLAGERSERVVEAVRALELPYRQVMTLILEDMSYAEIAETLGISLANVGVRVSRAKSKLKAMLDHE
jgi:RNA polymerase sigma-70 factor (ECF subfamily)